MSRVKSRAQSEICGDCGASDPSWASINRGILLCAECCSVHRSLGRHISQVKSLRQGTWSPSVLNLVNSLNAHGANSVWEHCLLDTNNCGKSISKRKPNPKDPLHPNKSEFIKAKHVNLTFVLKPNVREDDNAGNHQNLEIELSKQLHASVRTGNLETSLRLLVQGADPNYFHEEKQSTPLHVATKFGQASQVELLLVYGAEINVLDGNGKTPIEVAKSNNFNSIAERLLEAMYEVTDRITIFLGGKKPDHFSTNKHLLIPEQNSSEISEQLKIARGRLQLVPNKMFEELVMDLYDEVDRRENEAIWATSSLNPDIGAVPFLPANPYLSATRNQGRQKLARFSPIEFAGLLTDVLIDARRRQNMANLRPFETQSLQNFNHPNQQQEQESNLSDDEPLYDAVASDDDYAALAPFAQQKQSGNASNAEVESLRRQLMEYISEINQLKTVVQKLSSENSELKTKFAEASKPNYIYDVPLRIDLNGTETETEPVLDGSANAAGTVNNNSNFNENMLNNNNINTNSSNTSNNKSTDNINNNNKELFGGNGESAGIKRPVSMYETRLGPYYSSKTTMNDNNPSRSTVTSMYHRNIDKSVVGVEFFQPFGEEVKHRTDSVTRRLKELCAAMQDLTNQEAFVPCAERIRVAVAELTAIFTSNSNEIIKGAIIQLNVYTGLIQRECENLQKSLTNDDSLAAEAFMQEVRDCALHIASATKTLVMQFQ